VQSRSGYDTFQQIAAVHTLSFPSTDMWFHPSLLPQQILQDIHPEPQPPRERVRVLSG